MKKVGSYLIIAGMLVAASNLPVAAQRHFDLATQKANVEIVGLQSFNLTGHALAVGDVNGDAIPDLVIGAPGLNAQSQPLAGRVYVIFGRPAFGGLVDLNIARADVEIEAWQTHGGLGTALAVADLNADGFGDIIIGQPGAAANAGENAGMISVILGRAVFPKVMAALEAEMQISGEAALNSLGEALATGDLNHDGVDDLIAGARLASPPNRPNGGKVYVIYGRKHLPPLFDLAQTPPDLAVFGQAITQFIGNAVAAGDLNRDGRDDLIIGNFKANTINGVDAGKTFVIFGSDSLGEVIDLATQEADLTISGSRRQDHLGIAVASGDFNGDGQADLMVGARGADEGAALNTGKIFVFLNPPSWPKQFDMAIDSADVTIVGGSDDANLGFSLAVGDLNSDGKEDLVMGAPFTSLVNRNQSGAALVVLGRAAISEKIIKAEAVDLTALGAAPDHVLGSAVLAGDLNHDGRNDIILAAESATPAGRVYVLSGELVTGVADEKNKLTLPTDFELHQNYPNPFNAGTIIPLEVPTNAGVFEVSIYNLQGQKLRSLFDGTAAPGSMQLHWDSRDDFGKPIASGLYLYVVKIANDVVMRRKLVLMK
ncbi:FG-GAP-like repeat-containing protein [candidate division KSB1 bacterium]|nr:FG-GAP-like repeat-containing protein [candidate division KSB1 bacterium]